MALFAAEKELELSPLVEALAAASGRVGAAGNTAVRDVATAAHRKVVKRDACLCVAEAETALCALAADGLRVVRSRRTVLNLHREQGQSPVRRGDVAKEGKESVLSSLPSPDSICEARGEYLSG